MDDLDCASDAADLDFDFERYFERLERGELSEAELSEFTMRVMGKFCRDVLRSDGDMAQVPFGLAKFVAQRLHQVLDGNDWALAFPLPWIEPPEDNLSRRGRRGLEIYQFIADALAERPNEKFETILRNAAEEWSLSYETIRDDYYDIKAWMDKKKAAPKWIFKKGSENSFGISEDL